MHLDEADDHAILSEVHMETCPPRSESWCTRFYYSHPDAVADSRSPPVPPSTYSNVFTLDDDGDMVIQRRTSRKDQHLVIHHSLATPVSRCGEQVWLGSCLLSDFLMSQRHMLLGGGVVTELGAGVGLASLTAAHFVRQVFLTDKDHGALLLAGKNRDANCAFERYHMQPEATASQPPHQAGCRRRAACLMNGMAAADALALPEQQTVKIRCLDWFALLDRFNFTLRDMDARASAFEHFMTYVAPAGGALLTLGQQEQLATEQQEQQGDSGRTLASTAPVQACEKQPPLFTGRQLDVSALPQFLEYDRSADLELWELQPSPLA
eukprot:gene13444-13570_t